MWKCGDLCCLEGMNRGPQRQEQGECQGRGMDGLGLWDIAGIRVHEGLPRCSIGAAKLAYCRCALYTPNITVQNTVSHHRGAWVVARECGSRASGLIGWQEQQQSFWGIASGSPWLRHRHWGSESGLVFLGYCSTPPSRPHGSLVQQ